MKHRKRRRSRTRSHSRRRTARRNPIRRRRRRSRNPLYVSSRRRRRRGYRRVRLNPIGRRRRHRRNPISFSGVTGSFKELLSKNTLTIAGGAVLGGLAASFLMSRYGPVKLVNGVQVVKGPTEFVLPGSRGQYGPLIYSVSIPLLGAAVVPMLLKSQAGRDLSKGMVIGAAVLLIQNVVNLATQTMTPTAGVTGTRAYVTGGKIRTLGAPQSAISPVGAMPLAQTSAFRGFNS